MITGHTVVKNEDQFVEYAILSVLPYLDKLLIYDTGSKDNTVEIIRNIRSEKIYFEEKGPVTPEELVNLREEQIAKTKTEFFMLVDGDEIWPRSNIQKFLTDLKNMPKEKVAVYCLTRNAVGDIYHYLPESAGSYRFQGKRGYFSMRGFRNVKGLTVSGIYPLETYKYQGRSLNDWGEKLNFCDTWYLHLTHLCRSSSPQRVAGFRLQKLEKGLIMKGDEIPEVFQNNLPPRRSPLYELGASIITPLKCLRRSLRL